MADSGPFAGLVRRFYLEHRTEPRPQIASYLSEVEPAQRDELLKLLLAVDIECRQQRGELVCASDYQELGPDVPSLVSRILSDAERAGTPVPSTLIAPQADHLVATVIRSSDPSEPEKASSTREQHVGPYRLIKSIGEGGMGSVYLAEQTAPVRRQVALKLIKTGMAGQEVLRRFQAERQTLAVMDHENIAKVLDAGSTDDGRLYFVMEYVPGIPMTRYADEHRLTLNERLELFVQVCRALQHAHQKGVLHRDIKPSNVLVRETDGRPLVKVIDFGLAKTLGGEQLDQTIPGQILGTYQYMSPEQAGANGLDVDTRTDVYSLGVLLYELLTGSTPLERHRLQELALLGILKAIREEEPPSPSSRLSAMGAAASTISEARRTSAQRLSRLLSRDLDWITLKALEKDRNRRYDGPAQLAEDILRFLRGDPVEATPPSLSYRLRKAVWRHRVAFSMATTVLVLMAAGLIGTTQQMWRAIDAESVAETRRQSAETEARRALEAEAVADEQRLVAEGAQRVAEAARQETEKTLARSDYFLGVAGIDQNRPGEAAKYLDRIPDEHREFEWHLARNQLDDSQRTYFTGASALGFSADGGTLQLWGQFTGIRQFRLSSEGPPRSISTSRHGVRAQFLANGTQLAIALKSEPEGAGRPSALVGPTILSIVDVDTGKELRRFAAVETGINTVKDSNDSSVVGAICQNGSLYVWETGSGRLRFRLPASDKKFSDFAISPNGTMLATTATAEHQHLSLWDGRTGELIREVPVGTGVSIWRLYFSPDGRHLAWSSHRNAAPAIHVWDVQEQREVWHFADHKEFIHHMAFSPDGLLLASCGLDRSIRVRNIATGAEVAHFKGHDSTVLELKFGPSGSQLVSRELAGTVKVWDLAAPGSQQTIDASGSVSAIAFHPQGSHVALGQTNGCVDLWDLRTGIQRNHQVVHRTPVSAVSFTGDGNTLASAEWGGKAVLMNTSTGEQQHEFVFCDGRCATVTIDSLARQLAATRLDDSSIEIWDLGTRQRARLIPTKEHMMQPVRLAFAPDMQRLAAIDGLSRVCVFSVTTGALIQSFNEKSSGLMMHPARLLSFGQQGDQLLASDDAFGVIVWNTDRGEVESRLLLDTDDGSMSTALLHPSGKRAVTVGRRYARIWDLETGEVLRDLNGIRADMPAVAFSDNGELLAMSAEPLQCRILRAVSDRMSMTLNGHDARVLGVVITPDGDHLVSGSQDGRAIVWNRRTREQIQVFADQGAPVAPVCISPTASKVVFRKYGLALTASDEQIQQQEIVSLWDIATGTLIAELLNHKTFLLAATFSSDESLVATVDGSRAVSVWDAGNGTLVHQWNDVWPVPVHLGFSADGQWIKGDSKVGATTYWNIKSQLATTTPPSNVAFDLPPSDRSADGHWQVHHHGNSVVVTDLYGAADGTTERLRRTDWHLRQMDNAATRQLRFAQLHHACCLFQLVSQAPESVGLEVERYFHTKSANAFLTNAILAAVKLQLEGQDAALLPQTLLSIRDQLVSGSDAEAAKYVLSHGGRIRLKGSDQLLHRLSELPLNSFTVAMIDFRSTQQFTEEGLAACTQLPELEHLDFVRTALTDAGLRHFAASRKLVVLDLVDAPVGDDGLQVFEGVSTIRHLWLGGTQTTDRGASYFKNCKDLRQLDLRATKISDSGLQSFQGCDRLFGLFLSQTEIADNGVAAFRNCRKLTHLNLSFTRVTDQGLGHFANCTELVDLNLTNTPVSDASLDQILQFKNLKILRVGGTQLSDSALMAIRKQLPECTLDVDAE